MKKLLMLLLLGILMLVGVGGIASSCERGLSMNNTTFKDSVEFSEMLVKCLPSAQQQIYRFNDVTDVVAYRLERQRQHDYDSIFMTLTDQQVSNICSVLFKHKRAISISEIVTEYSAYKRVYDGLPEEGDESAPSDNTIHIDAGIVELTPDTV